MSRYLTLLAYCLLFAFTAQLSAADKPNIIIIFTDDQGYNDLSCFGSKTIKTPHLDQMAKEGRKFKSFMVPSPVCSPSRAALLTGSYPKRVGMEKHVVFPAHTHGLHKDEVTIADMLKGHGYATACVGKWHLGHRKPFLPTSQGFDSYYGIPYSNDMNHPDNKNKPKVSSNETWLNQDKVVQMWKTPLMQDEKIIEMPVNQRTITRRYTDKAIDFIKANKANPFFLYLPHSMPHIPLFVPDDAFDPNVDNAYKAVIEHIDAEVGRVMKTVKDLGLSEKTYVIFTTDNGPWLQFKNHGGSALPLRAGKGTTYEGGQRVPCIMWAPGKIPAGTETNALASTMDLLPTIAKITGAELKPRGEIDGMDISELIHGGDKTPRNEFIYYSSRGALEGLRQGDWKLRIATPRRPRRKKGQKPAPMPKQVVELYNLADDISESKNLAKDMPEKVEALKKRMQELDSKISAKLRTRGQWASTDVAE